MCRAHPENGKELGGCNDMEQGCVVVRDETAKASGSEHLAELFRLYSRGRQESESCQDKGGNWKN